MSATMPTRLSQYVPRCASRSFGSGAEGGEAGRGDRGATGTRARASNCSRRASIRVTVSSSRRTTSRSACASSSAMPSLSGLFRAPHGSAALGGHLTRECVPRRLPDVENTRIPRDRGLRGSGTLTG